jgi:murein tripeptide amidase MpaA
MYIVDHLTANYGVERDVTDLLDAVELILVPFTNPDGYAYTWTNTRLWRKNRSPAPSGSTCIGTDLNRNYRSKWGQGGSSTNPCSDT